VPKSSTNRYRYRCGTVFGRRDSFLESTVIVSEVTLGALLSKAERRPPTWLTGDVKQFRDYCGLTKIARCGFSWRKTTKKSIASVYTNCETALADGAREAADEGNRVGV
jgi:hypothetical protein